MYSRRVSVGSLAHLSPRPGLSYVNNLTYRNLPAANAPRQRLLSAGCGETWTASRIRSVPSSAEPLSPVPNADCMPAACLSVRASSLHRHFGRRDLAEMGF